jgi:hypothetical protein
MRKMERRLLMLKRKGDWAILQGVIKGSYMSSVWIKHSTAEDGRESIQNNKKRISQLPKSCNATVAWN